ncbi:hypothetical protein ASF57_07940 [Methylobacterium sp. Leaf117]|nr:hypothetical protein ASF57_07940 [Methylobacterium sp. Leaf117]
MGAGAAIGAVVGAGGNGAAGKGAAGKGDACGAGAGTTGLTGRVTAGGTTAWVPAFPTEGGGVTVRVSAEDSVAVSVAPSPCGRRNWMIPARTAATTISMPTRRIAEPLSIVGGLALVNIR